MSSLLNRTQTVIDDCEVFLKNHNGLGSPVEAYLVQHALVVLCADVQQEIYKLVQDRANQLTDKQVSAFVGTVSKRVLRSVRKDELATFVSFFGAAERDKFNSLLDDAEVTRYNNAVSNRHDVAHKTGVQITFGELKLAKVAACKLLSAVAASIESPASGKPTTGSRADASAFGADAPIT